VTAKPPRAVEILTEEARQRAKPLYRALRDAGPAGLTREELAEAGGLDIHAVLLAVHWMRFKGVDINLVPGLPGEGSRFVLVPMAPAFDATV
jgi:hypothetical protein